MAATSVFDFTARALDGSPLPLEDFRGQVLLIVNTASECGFTPQYAGLESLQRRFAAEGFSVIGFPCNQFGGQEPGSAEAIDAFCARNYDLSFPLAEKIEVKGPNAHPLFRFLCQAEPGVLGTEAIKWNFTKFLVNREGKVVKRYAPTTRPEEIADEIRPLLGVDAPVVRDDTE